MISVSCQGLCVLIIVPEEVRQHGGNVFQRVMLPDAMT